MEGFHKENLGLLAIPEVDPLFIPCTALSVVTLLEYYNIPLKGTASFNDDILTLCFFEGAHCTIVGASANVGIPLFMLLIRKGVTVTGMSTTLSE